MIRCTIGVMAYNEAQNIRHALHALLAQELQTVEVVEILVMASGCTDDTVELASAGLATASRGSAAAQHFRYVMMGSLPPPASGRMAGMRKPSRAAVSPWRRRSHS